MDRWRQDDVYLRMVDTDVARPALRDAPGEFEFRMRRHEDDALVGFVALFAIEWGNRTAQCAIGIGDAAFRGKGYGTEGLTLLLQYAFRELNLHRVGLDVISYNQSAINLYERLGFQLEGRRRQAVWREGRYFDRLDMGILYDEWIK